MQTLRSLKAHGSLILLLDEKSLVFHCELILALLLDIYPGADSLAVHEAPELP